MSRFKIEDAALEALPENLQKLYGFLLQAGLTPSDIEAMANFERLEFGTYQTTVKREDGTPEVVTNRRAGIVVSPNWAKGPEWPVIQPGPKVPKVKVAKRRSTNGWRRLLAIPDIQAGYYRGPDGGLLSIHDEEAVAAALRLVVDLEPDVIVLHGDNADFAEAGRYRTDPVFAETMQPTIDWITGFCARLRELAPTAEIIYLAGNHEQRLPNLILDNARAAFRLRRGRDTPADWPVLTLPHLCHLADSGITFLDGYPANSYVFADGAAQVIHGHYTGKNATAKYLEQAQVSTIYGHTHHPAYAQKRVGVPGAERNIFAATGGCLCRLDGSVPSTKSGHDGRSGQPVPVVMDWGHGVVFAEWKGATVGARVIPITDGRAFA